MLESGELDDGTVYMVQELLKGEDWRDLLDRTVLNRSVTPCACCGRCVTDSARRTRAGSSIAT